MSEERVSIIVIAHNEGNYIEKCIQSLLNQSYRAYELIVINSNSSDNTAAKIKGLAESDARVRFFSIRENGYAAARNAGIEHASAPYVFFIDADCIAMEQWIETGVKAIEQRGVIGASGLTYYVSKEYIPTVRDRVVYNKEGKVYPTCNMALRKDTVKTIGNFRMRYNEGLEDWDLAFRLMKYGEITFSKDMVVCHQKKLKDMSLKPCVFGRMKNVVCLIKDYYGNKHLPYSYVWGRIVLPMDFCITFFPPFLFIYYALAKKRFNIFSDFRFIVLDYISRVIARVIIWKTAFRERIFLI